VIPELLRETLMERRFTAPRFEPGGEDLVRRGVRQRLLVDLDRTGQVVGAIQHFPEQQGGWEERGLDIQRVDQQTAGRVGLAEQVGRETGAEEHGRLLRHPFECLGERRCCLLRPAGVQRIPTGARLLGGREPLRRRGFAGRHHEHDRERDDLMHSAHCKRRHEVTGTPTC
jgi:hypothetical protein